MTGPHWVPGRNVPVEPLGSLLGGGKAGKAQFPACRDHSDQSIGWSALSWPGSSPGEVMHQLKANAVSLGIGRAQSHLAQSPLGRRKQKMAIRLETVPLCSGCPKAVAPAPGSWANARTVPALPAQHRTIGCGLVPGEGDLAGWLQRLIQLPQTNRRSPRSRPTPFSPLAPVRPAWRSRRSIRNPRRQHQAAQPRRSPTPQRVFRQPLLQLLGLEVEQPGRGIAAQRPQPT